MSILDHFPSHMTPRPVQERLLKSFEEVFSQFEVIGLEAPTASGKSACAMTIASWVRSQHMGVVLTKPTKVLVNQDKANYIDFPTLKSTWDMPCGEYSSVGRAKLKLKKWWRQHSLDCRGCENYEQSRMTAKNGDAVLCNAYTYLAHRTYKEVLVMDEGHNTVQMLRDLHTKKWWKTDILRWPAEMWTRKEIGEWLVGLPSSELFRHKLSPLLKEIESRAPRFSITRSVEVLRGKKTEVLKMIPIDMVGEAPLLWPNRVKKIVFMSATMNQKDLDAMGLGHRRCVIIPGDSPIPVERRPIFPVCSTSMSFSSPESKLDQLKEFILECLDKHQGEKGLIHLPYELAERMRERVSHPRLLWHTKQNKSAKYARFMRSNKDLAFVCSGLHEGVDLIHDAGRWQIIGKVPWPSLADPAVKEWSIRDGDAYVWETLKQVIQACGRVCRSPDDFGSTYIFDSSFNKLMRKAEDAKLIPSWWSDAIKEVS